jgi:FkbM family methyltransferase
MMPGSWTLKLFRKYWPCLSAASVLRLRSALRDKLPMVTLRVQRPYRLDVTIRTESSDLWGIKETFLDRAYKVVTDAVRQCRTIIDLGANAGLAALYFEGAYPDVRILAVEPVPETAAVLKTNLARGLHSGRHQVLQCAAWSDDRSLALVPGPNADAFTYVSTRPIEPGDASAPITRGKTMQQLIDASGFDQIDLLKIDIEGAERELFRGHLRWLDRVRSIAIEFHDTSREDIGFDKLMRAYGFAIVAENRHTVVATRS